MIKYIKIDNFKGYRSLKLNFSNNFSVLTGQNNAGKTTILEGKDSQYSI
jgi:AAA15 family ATPase/GTPase